jgi:hypothetical protein
VSARGCRNAPFGKGRETVLNENSQKARKIDASLVNVKVDEEDIWEASLKQIVQYVCCSLGLLYKILSSKTPRPTSTRCCCTRLEATFRNIEIQKKNPGSLEHLFYNFHPSIAVVPW